MLEKQELLVKEFVWDFAEDGGAVGAISLLGVDPIGNTLEAGVLVTDVIVVNETALTSTGTPTITIGPTADPDGYLADIYAAVTAVDTTVRVGQVDGALLWDTTADAKKAYRVSSTANTQDVLMTIGTAPLSAGKLRVMVMGVKPGTASHP